MKQYINEYFSIFFGALFFFTTQGFAQESHLLKELRIPQVAQENPGAIIPYDAHISFPFAGKIHVGVNLPFSYGDIFHISDDFLKKLNSSNAIRTWIQDDPIHFGFRSGKNYFSITTAIKTDFHVRLQKDIFSLLIEGNGIEKNEILSLAKNDFISVNSFLEFGIGYNREINEKFSFGVNVKYLAGILNVHTKTADLRLTSGENYHELILNSSIDGKITCVYDANKTYEIFEDTTKSLGKNFKEIGSGIFHNIFSLLSNEKNHGFSIDVGTCYKINDILEISVSVLDIGFIKWTTNPYQLKIENKPFSFKGYVSEEDIFEDSDGLANRIGKYFGELGDSLLNNFSSEIEASKSYIRWLNTRFNVGFSIYATPKDRFNLNFRGLFTNNIFIPSGSVSYTRNVGKWFDVVVGNTFKPNSLLNPGLGLNFTVSVFQLYTVVDYSNTLLYIDRAKNLNVVVGINFVAPLGKSAFKASYPY